MVYRFRVGICPLSTTLKQSFGEVAKFLLDHSEPTPVVYFTPDGMMHPGIKQEGGIPGARVSHAVLLINTDVFDFDQEGWHRHKNVGRDYKSGEHKMDWDFLGEKVNGTTKVSPDKLEEIIRSEGKWEEKTPDGKKCYNVLNHNCHQFVMYCLDKIGAGFFYKGYSMPLMKTFNPENLTKPGIYC